LQVCGLLYIMTLMSTKTRVNRSKVLAVWQPIGYSTHHLTKMISEKLGIKTTHTGTLDPMAEGVVVVLLDDERFKKLEHTDWRKGYEFEIVLGIATDSYDGMGFVTKTKLSAEKAAPVGEKKLEELLKKFEGAYIQKVPIYSAKKYKGKKLFEYARENIDVEDLPEKEGTLFKLKLLKNCESDLGTVVNNILERLENMKGDFRQEEIIKKWHDFMDIYSEAVPVRILKIYAETSRGIYVRSLSQDICERLGVPGFVYSLVRVKNGEYKRESCKSVEDLC
jgi:tRNA pseudouridine55 synthase